MKTYSIGRDVSCDIVVSDSTDVVSRRHALLNIGPSGKMTIIDQSTNGTYVNGIRISQNVPVPVTRKDIVSFAHVTKLDWSQVPDSSSWKKYLIGSLIAVAVVAIIVGIVLGVKGMNFSGSTDEGNLTPAPVDSSLIKQQEAARQDSIRKAEAACQDSIRKAVEKSHRDSVRKAVEKSHRDSVRKAEEKARKEKVNNGKKTTAKKEDKKKAPAKKDSTNRRTVG